LEIRATSLENQRLARILADAGHEVDVITYPLGAAEDYPGVTVYRCREVPLVHSVGIGFSPAKLFLDLSLMQCAVRLARENEYDCIHGVEEGALIGGLISRRLGIPLIYDMDSVLSYEIAQSGLRLIPGMRTLSRFVERWAIRRATVIITISEHMAQIAREINPKAHVAIIPDIPLSSDVEPDPTRIHEFLAPQCECGECLILYAGSFARYQGLDLLIGAMRRITDRKPDAALVLVGGNNEEIAAVRRLAENAGVAASVHFVGKRPPEEIPHFLAAADVLVSPRSRGMNPPAKVATYMKSGTPVVATDIPAHTAILSPDAAFLTPPTANGLALGIIDALSDHEEAHRRAERARESVSSLTWDLHRRQVLDAYATLGSQ
jgi:glycosyltransferase involved in cell wall biosynthesis